jgi:carbamate kinase
MAVKDNVILIALGGNALIQKGQEGTIEEQFDNLKVPMRQIAKLSRRYKIIITHGNGPQVGNLLLQQECCRELPRMPLEILVAQTQGQIGYMIESTLDTELMTLGVNNSQKIISVISYVVVDENDPAFKNATKPIGPAFSYEQSLGLPYPTRKTEKGYRRVVVSPKPVTIVEKREIKNLIKSDYIVICCGGGGIPVIREGRRFCGVDAVIDKDLASAMLARQLRVDLFVIATDVPGAALDFGTPQERFLDRMSLSQAQSYLEQNQFAEGAMAPKVQACMDFIRHNGPLAVITHLSQIENAVKGTAGTRFLRDGHMTR